MTKPSLANLAFILILVVFLGSRLVYLNSGIIISEPDEWYYYSAAVNVANDPTPKVAGIKPMVHASALFEYLTYGISLIVKDSIHPQTFMDSRLISIISGFLLLMLIYRYVKRKENEKTALYAALLFTITPILLFYTKIGLLESLLMLTIFLFYMKFEHFREGGYKRKEALEAGLLLGLAVCTKTTALILFAVPVFSAILATINKITAGKNLANLSNLKLSFVKNWREVIVNNFLVGIVGAAVVFVVFLPYALLYPRVLKDSLVVSTIAHKSTGLIKYVNNVTYYLMHMNYWLTVPVIIFSVIGVLLILYRRDFRYLTLFIFLLLITGFLVLNEPRGRYFVLAAPFLTILASLGLRAASNWLEGKVSRVAVNLALPMLLIGLIFPTFITALESTNHSVIEQAVVRVRKETNSDPNQTLLFSTFWPPIVQYTSGFTSARLSTSALDAYKDYGEYPGYSPKFQQDPLEIVDKHPSLIFVFTPLDNGELGERKNAVDQVEKRYKPKYVITDNKPNFPDFTPPYTLTVYKTNGVKDSEPVK